MREGLDENATRERFWKMMGCDGMRDFFLPVKSFVWPKFKVEFLQEDGRLFLARNQWGGIKRNLKGSSFMPLTVSGAVKDRVSWDAFQGRLEPNTPGRLPDNWYEICEKAKESNEPVYTGDLPIGFFGSPWYLLGFERQIEIFYRDPDLMHDILDTLCDLWIALYTKVQLDVAIDYFFIWEDMCFKGGPLISPALFREFLLPRYKRLTRALKEAGVKLIFVDSDGDFRKLIPLWIEGGVDITFPWETQFGLDITEQRLKHPKLGMIGGIDKHVFIYGRTAVDRELEKVPFMLQNGRYIPAVDHEVPYDVSWDTYCYFCKRLRELVWKYPPNAS